MNREEYKRQFRRRAALLEAELQQVITDAESYMQNNQNSRVIDLENDRLALNYIQSAIRMIDTDDLEAASKALQVVVQQICESLTQLS